jgi:hypothetical protein
MCDDMNACTDDYCDDYLGCINLSINCDDSNEDTYDYCDMSAGCLHRNLSGDEPY